MNDRANDEIYFIPHSVNEEEEDEWILNDEVNNVEYTIEYFGNGEEGEPEGGCLIVSPMTFQLENNCDEYFSDHEISKLQQQNDALSDHVVELQTQEDYFDDVNSQTSSSDIECIDPEIPDLTKKKEKEINHLCKDEMENKQYNTNCTSTIEQLLSYKAKYEESLRKIEESIENRITETTEAIQEAVKDSFSEMQNTIHTQQTELDLEKSLRQAAETENQNLEAQMVSMKKQIEEDQITFSDLLEENELLRQSVKQFREKNVYLKQMELERQKEVERLKGDIALQQLEYRDMIEENKRGKKNEELFKFEKQKLATQKTVLSRELDIHFYRKSISGNSFDKTSIDSMKGTPVSSREKELEQDIQIFKKRMELLQPNLDMLKDLFMEQIANMSELVNYSKKLVKKLEDESSTKIELRKSTKRNFEKEYLRMEYQRLTRYDSDEEEFDEVYSEQEKQYNRILREKDKQLQVFRVAYETLIDKTEDRRQVLEVEFDGFLQLVKDLQRPKTTDEEEIIQQLLKKSSSSSSLMGKQSSPKSSILSSTQPKSFMISHFQKNAVKLANGRQRSQSYTDLVRSSSLE